MKIYLAGKVPKGDNDLIEDWRSRYRRVIRSPEWVIYLDPNVPVDESDPMAVFGMDCSLIQLADIVVANVEEKLWLGTSQELLVAKYFSKPVVSVVPKDSAHRKSNLTFHGKLVEDWIHPFLFATSDVIVESADQIDLEFMRWVKVKSIGIIDEAIWHFHSTNP